ncbi:alpha/beta hydrolase [Rummeliibacillus pycnus]|uniref:alpha/beta hydrolase n=1 Tax=Rummeliibacillus pycnus TaxID=101070 RepID=UPI003D2DA6AD
MINSFTIPILNHQRTIQVYLPKNYRDVSKRYPVLYMHDGQNVFENEDAIGGVALELNKYLEQNNLDLIIVAIDQNTYGDERINEYCPWINGQYSEKLTGEKSSLGGKGKEYVNFIVNELKPLIDRKYRTEKNQTYMAGISLGALISTYAACCYPDIFKRVASISSAFYRNQEEIEKLLKMRNLTCLERFYLDCGTMESGQNDEISKLFLSSNKAIYEILRNKNVKSRFNSIEQGEHNYKAFKERVPNFISYLMAEQV